MKKLKSLIILISFVFAAGCEQEQIDLKPPVTTETPTPTAGDADFSKYVAIGTSISAGFQAGALFTDGQNESLGAILSKQFAGVNSNAAFNQPTIGSVNGYNSSFPGLGRLILFDPDGLGSRSPSPTPSKFPGSTNSCTGVITPALPAPYNTADLPGAYAGNKSLLNNFSVPGIVLAQILIPQTGGPPGPAPFNALYYRFASNPGTSTILGDAITAAPTFFSFELGYNDVLGYAVTGGDGSVSITNTTNFSNYLNAALNPLVGTSLLGSDPNRKGVVANILDVTKLPFFSLVAWNSIVLPNQATIDATNNAYAAYNGGLVAVGGAITPEERTKRTINFTTGKNGIVITDKTLTDLTGLGLPSIRQATADDKIALTAGAILGTLASPYPTCDPSSVYGVGVPLADKYVLLPTEIQAIKDSTAAFNASISALVAANPTRLALADLDAAFNGWVGAGAVSSNGILVLPSITPPLAGFSEDAVHPNGKGTAVFANVFIDAINATFNAELNKADVTKYKGTRTPVYP